MGGKNNKKGGANATRESALALTEAKRVNEGSGVWLKICVALLVLSVFVRTIAERVSTQPAALTKPYETFEEFFPHYMREHSDQTNRYLHCAGTGVIVLLGILNPALVLSMGAAGAVGYSIFPFFRHMETGVIEAAIVLPLFLFLAWRTSRSWKLALFVPLCGYFFAW